MASKRDPLADILASAGISHTLAHPLAERLLNGDIESADMYLGDDVTSEVRNAASKLLLDLGIKRTSVLSNSVRPITCNKNAEERFAQACAVPNKSSSLAERETSEKGHPTKTKTAFQRNKELADEEYDHSLNRRAMAEAQLSRAHDEVRAELEANRALREAQRENARLKEQIALETNSILEKQKQETNRALRRAKERDDTIKASLFTKAAEFKVLTKAFGMWLSHVRHYYHLLLVATNFHHSHLRRRHFLFLQEAFDDHCKQRLEEARRIRDETEKARLMAAERMYIVWLLRRSVSLWHTATVRRVDYAKYSEMRSQRSTKINELLQRIQQLKSTGDTKDSAESPSKNNGAVQRVDAACSPHSTTGPDPLANEHPPALTVSAPGNKPKLQLIDYQMRATERKQARLRQLEERKRQAEKYEQLRKKEIEQRKEMLCTALNHHDTVVVRVCFFIALRKFRLYKDQHAIAVTHHTHNAQRASLRALLLRIHTTLNIKREAITKAEEKIAHALDINMKRYCLYMLIAALRSGTEQLSKATVHYNVTLRQRVFHAWTDSLLQREDIQFTKGRNMRPGILMRTILFAWRISIRRSREEKAAAQRRARIYNEMRSHICDDFEDALDSALNRMFGRVFHAGEPAIRTFKEVTGDFNIVDGPQPSWLDEHKMTESVLRASLAKECSSMSWEQLCASAEKGVDAIGEPFGGPYITHDSLSISALSLDEYYRSAAQENDSFQNAELDTATEAGALDTLMQNHQDDLALANSRREALDEDTRRLVNTIKAVQPECEISGNCAAVALTTYSPSDSEDNNPYYNLDDVKFISREKYFANNM